MRFLTYAALLFLLAYVSATPSLSHERISVVGTGFGGLYMAFRLQNDSSSGYLPSDIHVWEASNRPGGRALTLKEGIFPTSNKVSLGAHKWDPDVDIIVDTVIKKVLGMNTTCYYRNQQCNGDDVKFYTFLRNRYAGDLSKSSNIPYKLDDDEKWNRRTGFPDLVTEMASQYPFIIDSLENLTSSDPSILYPAIRSTLDRFRTEKVDGYLPNQLTIRTMLNRSSEFWELMLSAMGEAYYILDVTAYVAIREALLTLHGGSQEVIVDSQGYEIGYQAKDEALSSLITSRGVNMGYNKKLASLKRSGDGSLLLSFADGTNHTTDKVVLNIGHEDLMRLSADSIVFTEASEDLKRMYDLIIPIPAAKVYGYYDVAWWKEDYQSGEVSTDTTANYYDLRDSNVECAGSSCKGWLNMAYPDGEYYKYFRNMRNEPDSRLTYIYANTTDPIQRKWFWDFNYQYTKSVCKATKQVICNIPAPSVIAMGIWDQAWHDFLPSNYPGGTITKTSSKITQGVYWINEAISARQGWAEGSALLAEQVLHNDFGLERPAYMGNEYWYEDIAVNPSL